MNVFKDYWITLNKMHIDFNSGVLLQVFYVCGHQGDWPVNFLGIPSGPLPWRPTSGQKLIQLDPNSPARGHFDLNHSVATVVILSDQPHDSESSGEEPAAKKKQSQIKFQPI